MLTSLGARCTIKVRPYDIPGALVRHTQGAEGHEALEFRILEVEVLREPRRLKNLKENS